MSWLQVHCVFIFELQMLLQTTKCKCSPEPRLSVLDFPPKLQDEIRNGKPGFKASASDYIATSCNL